MEIDLLHKCRHLTPGSLEDASYSSIRKPWDINGKCIEQRDNNCEFGDNLGEAYSVF